MGNGNLLYESIFKRKLSDAGTREYLIQVTKDHPYFAPAHFYLLLQTEKNSASFEQQAAKTAILFNNPYWLQFQLHEKKTKIVEEGSESIVATNTEIVAGMPPADIYPEQAAVATSSFDHPKIAIDNILQPPEEDSMQVEEHPLPDVSEDIDTGISTKQEETIEEISGTHVIDDESGLLEEPVTEFAAENIIPQEDISGEENLHEPLVIKQADIPGDESMPIDVLEEKGEEMTPVSGLLAEQTGLQNSNVQEEVRDEDVSDVVAATLFNNDAGPLINESNAKVETPEDETFTEPAITAQPEMQGDESIPVDAAEGNKEAIIHDKAPDVDHNDVQVSNVQDDKVNEEKLSGEEISEVAATTHLNNDATPLINEPDAEVEAPEREIAPMNFKLNINTADITEDRISFEPLHTSDYFASLGIKLSSEIKPTDKLGKQLKSFTEWLKTMKKINGDQIPEQNVQADHSIQQLAEQSNQQDAVLTEAMAEVLLQQGKSAKAIEVYKKLSLLNPSKSAYFAAKIDQLNEH
ncbi:MAG: hypothetical protein ABIN94_02085 [Ferruginibacter sp.]